MSTPHPRGFGLSEKAYIPLWLKVCEKDDESLLVEWTYQLCKAVEQERERCIKIFEYHMQSSANVSIPEAIEEMRREPE